MKRHRIGELIALVIILATLVAIVLPAMQLTKADAAVKGVWYPGRFLLVKNTDGHAVLIDAEEGRGQVVRYFGKSEPVRLDSKNWSAHEPFFK